MQKRRFLTIVPVLVLFVVVFMLHAGFSSAQTNPFINPKLPAPSGITRPFLDTSADPQTKEGSLTLDGTSAVALCLGGSAAPTSLCPVDAEGQTNNSIELNGTVTTFLGQPPDGILVEKILPNTDALYPSTALPYVWHEGFAEITARVSQQWAFLGQGDGRSGGFLWVAGLVGDANRPLDAIHPTYGVRGETTVNRDDAYGIYGLDDNFDPADFPNNSSAAKFSGKVQTAGDLIIGDNINKKRICLNGQVSGNCISSWDPNEQGFDYLHLQQNGVAISPETGSVRVVGNAQMQALIVGSTVNIPIEFTQGDGSCNNEEAPGSPDC